VSAAGRGAERREHDYYPTPAWCVRRIVEALGLPRGTWLEPSAGDGAIVREVRAHAARVVAMEIRAECRDDLVRSGADVLHLGDALVQPWERADVVIGNPPYALADDFVRRALECAPHVVFLLRLNWLAARGRVGWLRDHTPDVWIMPERPSFDGSGGTDATSYAWLHWHPNAIGRVRFLDTTPATERRLGGENQLRIAGVV
jgi:hypothetical protein